MTTRRRLGGELSRGVSGEDVKALERGKGMECVGFNPRGYQLRLSAPPAQLSIKLQSMLFHCGRNDSGLDKLL